MPYSLERETDLDDALRSWLAFGAEKVHEVATLARALRDGPDAVAEEIEASNAAVNRLRNMLLNDFREKNFDAGLDEAVKFMRVKLESAAKQ